MTPQTIRQLNQLNQQFYQTVAADFALSREKPWEGWASVFAEFQPAGDVPVQVLDVGCGTGRFAAALAQQYPDKKLEYVGVDNSRELLKIASENTPAGKFEYCDIVENLLTDQGLIAADQQFQIITIFGVMHHIPSQELRQKFLTQLNNLLAQDGQIWLATWQFATQPRFQEKYIPPEKVGLQAQDLETNDYFLPWERGNYAIRYCHFTTDEEIAELAARAGLQIKKTFASDGKTHDLNHYFILVAS